jgi:hypothetical protein
VSDETQREMTLKEWCAKLPEFHRANKELAKLEAVAEAIGGWRMWRAKHGTLSRQALEALLAVEKAHDLLDSASPSEGSNG